MSRDIKKIVIVGGGTAGWITAGMLASQHKRNPDSDISIVLIESSDIPTIGVGEGTFPTMRKTLSTIGITETDLIRQCDATFKQGAKFVSWRLDDPQEFYYHPFNVPSGYGSFDITAYWQKPEFANKYGRFAEAVDYQDQICEAGLAPKKILTPEYQSVLNYAYHFDAAKVANLIKEKAMELGVIHVDDGVLEASLDNEGYIEYLVCKKEPRLEGDLFVDCTGFSSLLLDKTYKVPFKSAKDCLFNDFALATQVPYDGDENYACHTIATAKEAGWIWDIGLSSRRGMGYVYSSEYTSHDRAHQVLEEHIGKEKAKNLTFRKIPYQSGYREKFWHKNCLAVGLSAGFLEPLEASALILVDNSAEWLSERLPADFDAMEVISKQFNHAFTKKWEAIVDFLKLHYVFAEREEPYWQDNIKPETMSERLRDCLAVWKSHPPHLQDTHAQYDVFPVASIQYVLYGLGFKTNVEKQPHLYAQDMRAQKHFETNLKQLDKVLTGLPRHRDLIEQIKAHGLQKI